MKLTRKRLMEVAGLRSPLNEATDYSAYVEKMEKLGEPYKLASDDGYAEAVKKYIEQNSATIKQAIASKLTNSKISGELAVSRDEFADMLLYWSYLSPSRAKLLSAANAFASLNSSGGTTAGKRMTDEWAERFSKADLKTWLDDYKFGYQHYTETKYGEGTLNEFIKDPKYALNVLRNTLKNTEAWWGYAHWILILYVINTQGGSEASTWKLNKDSAKMAGKFWQDEDEEASGQSWGPELEKLMEAKDEQAAEELMKAVEAGFDAWVGLAMSDGLDKLIAQTPPEGVDEPTTSTPQISGKQAAKELQKDATLKGEFEKWLVNVLETGGATQEDLVADFGDGMNLDPDDLDMDDIVSNIINNKKYSDDLGDFFSEYKDSLNESIFEQIVRAKRQLLK